MAFPGTARDQIDHQGNIGAGEQVEADGHEHEREDESHGGRHAVELVPPSQLEEPVAPQRVERQLLDVAPIDADFARLVYLTSPLHDIGKVGIPDSVLLKPNRLSPREFEIMKAHTTIGAETLEAAAHQSSDGAFLRMARDIALTHHERFDGSGYPAGLAGEYIPLCGRIVALAFTRFSTPLFFENFFDKLNPHSAGSEATVSCSSDL